MRSSLLKRVASKQTVASVTYRPSSSIWDHDAKSLPRQRWKRLSVVPVSSEYTSEVDSNEVRKLVASKEAGDVDADTALRQLAADFTSLKRRVPRELNRSAVGPKLRNGKRGPHPSTRHLLRVFVFDLLLDLKEKGIAPTQLGAKLVAEEISKFSVRWQPDTVVSIWKSGQSTILRTTPLK